jgi:hypothetical protein
MQRYLAHKIVIFGVEYKLSILTIDDNNVATIEPFYCETASTAFVDGTIYVVPLTSEDTHDVNKLLIQSQRLSKNEAVKIVVIN